MPAAADVTVRSGWGSETEPRAFDALFRLSDERLRSAIRKRIYLPPGTVREDLVHHIAQEAFLALDRAWSDTKPEDRTRFLFSAAKVILRQETARWRIARSQLKAAYDLLARTQHDDARAEAMTTIASTRGSCGVRSC